MIVHVCKEPSGGGSIRRAWEYPLAVELSEKPPALTFDATKLTPEQRASVAKLYGEANAMESRGVGEIWRPADGGPRPAALYVRGLYSMESGPDELEALHAANPRAKNPVAHIVFSLTEEESKVVSPEQLIKAAERAMDYAGFAYCPMLLGVHADQENLHCHVIASTISPQTLRVVPKHGRIGRLHQGARRAEKDFGMKPDFGLWHTRSDGQIVPTLRPDWEAYNREYSQRTSRSEELAKTFVADNEGLESAQDRCDRVVYALREYLEHCAERGEQPLRSDFHRLAAQLTCTLENAKDGRVVVRLMDRAEPGTVRSTRVDAIGEVHAEIATWAPTATAFVIDPSELVVEEIGGQKKTVRPPAWLRSIGDLEAAAAEAAELIERDPARISRDLIAGGQATFSLDDFDRWTAERMSFGWLEASDAARKADRTLKILSPLTTLDLLTTQQQLELEQRVFERATRLSQMRDPRFNRAALDRAIADEEKAGGLTFSEQQRAVFGLLEYRFGLVQGDAGVGKSTLMAVLRRYCELTGREIAGFTTSQRAAAALGEKSGIRSLNTARAQVLESTRGEEMIRRGSHAVLDEVSMVSFEAVDAFLARVEKQGASGIGMGDAAQLPNIGAGDTMRVLRRAVGERFVEVTQVYRQEKGSAVEWMREAIPRGGKAIRECDADAFVAYVGEYAAHGVIVHHENRTSEVAEKATDIVDATRRGIRVMAPARDRTESHFVNAAVRRELGLEGTGQTFTFRRGRRELAPGDRIQFERNAEKTIGVLNGWTGTVLAVAPRKVLVELDGGKRVAFDPVRYRHVDFGWALTVHKSQGSGDPQVIATIAKSDDPHSLHTALTRCEQGLRVHTRLTREQIDEQMRAKLTLKRDALFYHEMEQAVGGPDSIWARTVRRAMESDRDPLHQEWRAEMHARAQGLQSRLAEIFHDVTLKSDRQRGIARAQAAREYAQTPFGNWAWEHRREIERRAEIAERAQEQRERYEAEQAHRRERDRQRAEMQATTPEQRARVGDVLAAAVEIEQTAGEAYLRGRGVSMMDPDALYHANFFAGSTTNAGGVSPGLGPAVVFQLCNREGEVVAAQARLLEPREGGPRMISVGNVSQGVFATAGAWESDVVAIVEAPIDAMSLADLGVPAIALCGAMNRPPWLREALISREVIIATDADRAGEAAAKDLSAWLAGDCSLARLQLPGGCKDANEGLLRDPDGLRATVAKAAAEARWDLQRQWRATWIEALDREPPRGLDRADELGQLGQTMLRRAKGEPPARTVTRTRAVEPTIEPDPPQQRRGMRR